MQGWRIRMEDAHIAQINQGKENKLHVFGVFDGHGGKEVSQFTKAHFTQELVTNQNYLLDDISTALIQTFLRIDELLILPEGKEELLNYSKLSKEEDERQDKKENKKKNKRNKKLDYLTRMVEENSDTAMMAGCTACVCVIDELNQKIYFSNAGDSRAVLCKEGKAFQMSIDHKPDLDNEKNRIYKADGWVNDGRIKCNLNLSRSLGDLEFKQNANLHPKDQMITAYPEIIIENYSQICDFIIVGCDGIWDCISNQDACNFVSERINSRIPLTNIINELMDELLSQDINNGIIN